MSAADWLYSTLTADNTIKGLVVARVYRDNAPKSAIYPFIVIQKIDTVPVDNAYRDNIMDNERWQVKIVDKSTKYTTVYTLAAAVRSALHKKASPANGIVSCTYDFGIERTDQDPSGAYKLIFQDYRLHTQ
jgi:hypothetical protein